MSKRESLNEVLRRHVQEAHDKWDQMIGKARRELIEKFPPDGKLPQELIDRYTTIESDEIRSAVLAERERCADVAYTLSGEEDFEEDLGELGLKAAIYHAIRKEPDERGTRGN